jgi:hypothetical protein
MADSNRQEKTPAEVRADQEKAISEGKLARYFYPNAVVDGVTGVTIIAKNREEADNKLKAMTAKDTDNG